MLFIETPVFSEEIKRLLTEEEYRALQSALLARPDQGPIIRGSGGIRKLRWGQRTSGKSGGIRVIYYWISKKGIVYLLFAYPKSRVSDLTKDQVRVLRDLVKEEFPDG